MDYGSNSFKSRDKSAGTPKKEEPKKREKVISGSATTRERSGAQKMADNIIVGNAKSTGNYILMDILLPAIKNTVWAMISNGIHMMLFGNSNSSSKGAKIPGSRITYGGYEDYTRYRDSDRGKDVVLRRAIFENPVLDTPDDAEALLANIAGAIQQYGFATWGDLYDAAGISTYNWQGCEKYGWTDVRGADIVPIHRADGSILYELRMPKAAPIDTDMPF